MTRHHLSNMAAALLWFRHVWQPKGTGTQVLTGIFTADGKQQDERKCVMYAQIH